MSDRMQSIWAIAREKQSLEDAALRLCKERYSPLGLKLSLSAMVGLVAALWPVAGAALTHAGLM